MVDTVNAAMIIIGNEVLSGRTHDKNLPYLAERLNDAGIKMVEVRVIPDISETIIETVRTLSARMDYVFTTGGIGPTHDDITADCVAAAFNVPLLEHPEARRRLEVHYKNSVHALNAARLRMARVPEGGVLIDNPVSAAPGFIINNVYVMAGVPKIMQAMLDGVLPTLTGGCPMQAVTIRSSLAEGHVAEALGRLAQAYPNVDIGSYPAWTQTAFQLSIVLRAHHDADLSACADAVMALVTEMGGTPERLYGHGK